MYQITINNIDMYVKIFKLAFTPVTRQYSFTSHDNVTLENEHWSGQIKTRINYV